MVLSTKVTRGVHHVHHRFRVLDHLPHQLQQHGDQESSHSLLNWRAREDLAGDDLEDDTVAKVDEAVGVKHVLRDMWGVPGSRVEGPPESIVPNHNEGSKR